jgi:hypothetical protein
MNQRFGRHASDPRASGTEVTAVDHYKVFCLTPNLAHRRQAGRTGPQNNVFHFSHLISSFIATHTQRSARFQLNDFIIMISPNRIKLISSNATIVPGLHDRQMTVSAS